MPAESMRNFDIADSPDGISRPVLVAGSGDGRVIGETASREISESIDGAELYMFDGCGHAV